jgi:hypothetical protein
METKDISTESLALRLEFLSEMWEETSNHRFVLGLRTAAARLRELQAEVDNK